jgi:hypothetical protein
VSESNDGCVAIYLEGVLLICALHKHVASSSFVRLALLLFEFYAVN